MTSPRVRRDHLALISKTHVKYSVRGGAGLVFVFFALFTGLIIAGVLIDPVEAVSEQAEVEVDTGEVLQEIVDEVGMPAVKFFTGGNDAQARYLVREKPALVSAFLIILVFFVPFIVALGAFNQTSGDIASRGLRYQLLRTERANIFFGRFLGTAAFTLAVLAALIAFVFVYLVAKAKFYPAGEVTLWMAQGYLAIAIYSLPWIALCAWISAGIDSPFGSLVIAQLVIGFWPLLIAVGRRSLEWIGYGGYLSPWGWKYWLFSPEAWRWLVAAAVMFGFTALFLWVGHRTFSRRDL